MNSVFNQNKREQLKILHLPNNLQAKILKTTKNTKKCDKYARLVSNILKLIRALSPELKKKYAKIYKQIIIVRQVIRWQGLYQLIIELHKQGWKIIQLENITNLAFMLLQAFGDLLDRAIFVLQLINRKELSDRLQQIDHLQSDCYFIQCIIWLFYHIRTFKKVWQEGNQQQKKSKILKIFKYILDSLTSYCKFSRRKWQLQPKRAAVLGIISSIIGMYQILK